MSANKGVKVSGKSFLFEKDSNTPKSHSLEFRPLELRPGGWFIVTDSKGLRRRVLMTQHQGKWSASLFGKLYQGDWISKSTGRSHSGGGGTDQDLIAQFPGKVRKILVSVGQSVSEGDALILVEAMKMEFLIKAPYTAKVKSILVKEAQQLTGGERFLELEQ